MTPFLLRLIKGDCFVYIRYYKNLNKNSVQQTAMFCPITPQKRNYPCLNLEESHLRELSPFPQRLPLSSHRKPTCLELLTSPLPANRDLFSQLLATELTTPREKQEIIGDEVCCEEGEAIECRWSQSQCDFLEEIDEESSEQGGIRKRRRKSTAQIKMLRRELEVEPSWTKDKVVEMSDLTGLSQSQVYKWWWDQKKKNSRSEGFRLGKQRPIHKDFERRAPREKEREEGGCYSPGETFVATKVKANLDLQQLPQTERKVNKRLVFA